MPVDRTEADTGIDWSVIFNVANSFRAGISYEQSQACYAQHMIHAGHSSFVPPIEFNTILDAFTKPGDDSFDENMLSRGLLDPLV